MDLLNSHDYRENARRLLPRGLFEYIDRGTEDEVALQQLRTSLDRINLEPAILNGSADCLLATQLFNKPASSPLIIAPTALAGLVAYEGEVTLARAAARLKIPFCVATLSITSIERIRKGAPDADLWFQLYLWKDRKLMEELLSRAEKAGCETLVFTVDNQVAPNREYNQRNRFGVPTVPGLRNSVDVLRHPRWMLGVLGRYLTSGRLPEFAHYPPDCRTSITSGTSDPRVEQDPNLNWDDLARLRDLWRGKLIVKGVLSVADALRCCEFGADAIVVSSHGGRNLDVAPVPADRLINISEAVGRNITVIADSGVRRGTDVLKYLALGAQATMLGRLPLWGLAAGGEDGAVNLLEMIQNEMRTAMGFLGAHTIDDLSVSQT